MKSGVALLQRAEESAVLMVCRVLLAPDVNLVCECDHVDHALHILKVYVVR